MSPSEPAASSVEAGAVRVVLMTAPDAECAQRIARVLVGERLAACVNLVPGIQSVYRWEGAVQEEGEVLLLAKTRADRVAELEARVRALHPYALPEVIAVPVEAGSDAYLRWVCAESAR